MKNNKKLEDARDEVAMRVLCSLIETDSKWETDKQTVLTIEQYVALSFRFANEFIRQKLNNSLTDGNP